MRPVHNITVDGLGLFDGLKLLSISVTDEDGDKADRVEITLEDPDGRLEIPERGALIDVSMGFAETGLTWLGSFTLDGASGDGPPFTMTISGTAADLAGAIRAPKTRAFEKKTLKQIVSEVAGDAGLAPLVEPGIGATFYEYVAQTSESDLHFLNRLARDLDAIAKPAAQKLVVVPKAAGINAEGAPIVPIAVRAKDVSSFSWQLEERENYGTVEAEWVDVDTGQTEKITKGGDEPIKRLRHVYANEDEATRAADAALKKAQREALSLSLDLATFVPGAFAGGSTILTGLKPHLSGEWYIQTVTHSLPPLVTSLELKKSAP